MDVPDEPREELEEDEGPAKQWNPSLEDDYDGTRDGDPGTSAEPVDRNGPPQYKELQVSSVFHVPSMMEFGNDRSFTVLLQEVLSACGFPWIEAPGEAEAQCVWLQQNVSEDSVVERFK